MVRLSHKVSYMLRLILVAVFFSSQVQGYRIGCASFGHSCLGAQGKRTDTTFSQTPIEQQERALDPSYGPREHKMSQMDFIPVIENPDYRVVTPEQYAEMNRYVKEWIINYLKEDKALM